MTVPRRQDTSLVLKDYIARILPPTPAVGVSFQPGICVTVPLTVIDAATGDLDFTIAEKCQLVEAWCIKRNGAGAGNTMQFKDGSGNAITDAMACAVDKTITRAATIDDTGNRHIIAAGGVLRLTATRAAGTRNAEVYAKLRLL